MVTPWGPVGSLRRRRPLSGYEPLVNYISMGSGAGSALWELDLRPLVALPRTQGVPPPPNRSYREPLAFGVQTHPRAIVPVTRTGYVCGDVVRPSLPQRRTRAGNGWKRRCTGRTKALALPHQRSDDGLTEPATVEGPVASDRDVLWPQNTILLHR